MRLGKKMKYRNGFYQVDEKEGELVKMEAAAEEKKQQLQESEERSASLTKTNAKLIEALSKFNAPISEARFAIIIVDVFLQRRCTCATWPCRDTTRLARSAPKKSCCSCRHSY